MTEKYMTPEVIHIQEIDCDGNISTVRYYRESIIEDFVTNCVAKLGEMGRIADAVPVRK